MDMERRIMLLIIIQDQEINRLYNNFGYPGSLDSGLMMQRQDGPAYLVTCTGGAEPITRDKPRRW